MPVLIGEALARTILYHILAEFVTAIILSFTTLVIISQVSKLVSKDEYVLHD